MTRVLHIFKTYYPYSYGGVEQVIESICTYCSSHGIYSEILVCGPESKVFSHQGIKVNVIKSLFSVSNNPISFRFKSELSRISANFDVVHFHYPYLMNELLIYLNSTGLPYIVTYHSDVIRSNLVELGYRLYSKRFLEKAHTVVFTSQNYSQVSYTRNMNLSREVIPLTVNQLDTQINMEASEVVNALDDGFVLFLGALRRYKGLKTLIEAARSSSRQFVIAGSGEEELLLKALVCSYDLDNVVFLGSVSEVDKYCLLRKCRFLCLPSDRKSEAFGVVLLEAFSAGKCVVTSNLNTGMALVNKHDQTGRVFTIGDYEHLNEQIEFLYNDQSAYERYCANALAASCLDFSPETLSKYVRLYKMFDVNRI